MDAIQVLPDYLPADAWTTDLADRQARSHDWWPLMAVRRRRGAAQTVPDLVILPRSTAEVAAALRWASETRTPVVPRGGGSGVCGGALVDTDGRAVLDLGRMDAVLDVDDVSQTVRVQAGIGGGRLEALLNERGLTLGHSPQSVEISTVGGWIAAASAGQFTPAYGAIEDRLLGYSAVTGDGLIFEMRPAPRSAAATNLRRLLVGTEGSLAVMTEVTLACAPKPGPIVWLAFRFPAFASTYRWARRVLRERAGPGVLRGYDEADALAAFYASLGHTHGAVGVAGFEASLPGLAGRVEATARAAEDEGGAAIDAAYGAYWLEHRFDAVSLFEQVNGPARALGEGTMLDTMEVAATWRDLPVVYDRVRSAIGRLADEVRCHFSHVYPAGAALYFTFVLRASDDDALDTVYADTWLGAIHACLDAGGTSTHHHGMGRLRAPYATAELTAPALEVYRRLKKALDPAGILNPGLLGLPSAESPAGSGAA